MDIEFFLPKGPQPTEMQGLEEMRRVLPRAWKGFANFVMRQQGRRGQDREIDLVLICTDRIVLADLKHIRGRIENRGGFWYREGESLGSSPAHKIRENAKMLSTLIRSEVNQIPSVPPIESVVILTHPNCDPGGLDQVERDRTIKLSDFLRIGREIHFKALFTTPTKYDASNSLNSGTVSSALQKFFRNGRLFEPRKTQFHGFVPTGEPEFTHRLFTEFACHQPEDPNYTGLLRLWDFSVDGDFIVEDARRPIAERERAVLGHIRIQDPTLYDNYVLRSIQHDGEFTLRYSEVFDRLPDLERLARFYGVLNDLPIERRIELARLLLDRVASLHRIRVAHRDLDRHSVWIDERRSKVVLSGFGASHFPERRSIAGTRSKLLAGGARVPEDLGEAMPGTAYQQDVFLVGALVWTLLSGKRLETLDQVPIWTSDTIKDGENVPAIFGDWFARCLKINATERYDNGIDAADAFSELARKTEKASLEKQLDGYRRDIDPISDYVPTDWISAKPHRIYKSRKNDETLFVKSWPERTLGERRKSAARLIEFFGKANALRQIDAEWLPRIDVACLCTDGLLLVGEWIDGELLSKSDTSLWLPENLRRFVTALVEAIEGLHDVDLVHGDLSPHNIIVRMDGDRPRPVLVDVVDFTSDEKGRSTPAYCPPDDSDLRVRDRFAVGQIALELAERCTDGETKALLLLGTAKCAEGAAPWLTLKSLKDAISMRRPKPAAVKLELTIETPRAGFEGMMLSDNGVFHVVKSKKAPNSIEISGFDQRVIVDFDPSDRRPIHAIANKIDMRGATWAQNHRAFSFEGSVTVRRSRPTRFSGFEDVLALLSAPLVEVLPQEPDPAITVPAAPKIDTLERSFAEHFPVARFWQETITAEAEISPEIKLASEPKYDEGDRTLYLVAEDNLPDVDPADGQSVGVQWNGYKLGDLDTERSRGTTVVIRNVRRARGLHKGAVLKVPDDLISFQRRSRAVARILEGKSQIANLIRYFDPSGELTPEKFGADITDEDIELYGLNPDQGEAFRHLWKHGPVGLLQGPPGTGKTKFIASFVHYALTKARLRNVLVLSQSHEAVNTAAERILQVAAKLDGSIDLLRVGQHSKISPMLHKYHARAIQDRYRELFRAGTKERIVAPASRLGLEKGYIEEAIEIETTLGSLARQIELCEQDIATSRDQDTVIAARERNGHLREIWKESVGSYPVAQTGEPGEVLNEIREVVAVRHGINDPDGRHRLLKIHRLAQEWTSALGMRGRSLEELVARSRNLICGTCVGIGRHGIQVDRNVFDLVIIDEAARCTPGELAVGMQSGRRVLLVGDHKQLPPLYGHELIEAIGERLKVTSKKDLKRSDFERAFHSTYGREVARSLLRQYRMAPKIGRLVAKSFYPGQDIKTERGDPPQYYSLLPSPLDDEIVWVDTGYSNSTRKESEIKSSFFNRREAIAAISILQAISKSTAFVQAAMADDLREDEPLVGVICMYAPQVSLIEEMLVTSDLPPEFKKLVKVGTVDSYQGKESRIIIVSLVRSNPEHHMGFVRTANRINVALSRAMERLVIIGSSKMFEKRGNALSAVVRELRAAKRIVGDGKGAR